MWKLSHRFDPKALAIANRHYSRQKTNSNRFVAPGSCLVLLSEDEKSLWVTSVQKYIDHQWKNAWINSFFRKEGDGLASQMILDAVAITRWFYGNPPEQGIVTFINKEKVKPTIRRSSPIWGYSYLKAGFEQEMDDSGNEILVKGKMLVFRLAPENMPEPKLLERGQLQLFSPKLSWEEMVTK